MATTPIGVGKYAKVYKAVSIKDTNKIYAVKVIRI
jgi:RIO-like serine/threonine protein kinase